MSHQQHQSAAPTGPAGQPQQASNGVPGRSWDARKVVRQRVVALKCNAGEIVDFSPRGMRITSRRSWKVGVSRTIVVASDEASVSVVAKCIWTRREGLMRHVVGLAFDGMNAAQTRSMETFVAKHGVSLNLDFSGNKAA